MWTEATEITAYNNKYFRKSFGFHKKNMNWISIQYSSQNTWTIFTVHFIHYGHCSTCSMLIPVFTPHILHSCSEHRPRVFRDPLVGLVPLLGHLWDRSAGADSLLLGPPLQPGPVRGRDHGQAPVQRRAGGLHHRPVGGTRWGRWCTVDLECMCRIIIRPLQAW